ncbi:MAG TPA: response regulator [Bryobacteraceae bacterium]|nr:response regulator [Bryobacteraceae bacterium]
MGKTTILVVDDEEYVVNLAMVALTRRGYEVIVARTASEALEAVRANPGRIALVLLDLRMPDKDGIDLLPILGAADSGLKFILSSGYFEADVLSRAEGGVTFLQKPYTVQKLAAQVETALSQR